jgi:DNA-binding NtrC family response regulator
VADIPQLLNHFQRQLSCGKLNFNRAALEVLRNHPWPGNVRELASVVHRLALTCEGVVGNSEVLHALGVEETPRAFPRWIFEGRSYSQALQEVKREYLLHLFELHGGDIDRISRELKTTKRNVYQRFIQVGLHAGDLRAGGRGQK